MTTVIHPITPQEALQRVIEHREIFHDEMLHVMRLIMGGEMSPVMMAAFISALRVKKETIGEITAAAQVMREFSTKVQVADTQHLVDNGQSGQKYELQFWRKVFYPLSCLVMVVLALPFAYLHFRSSGIAGYVFGGVMAGISFLLLNNVLSDMAMLQGWQPWLAAALPGLIYSVISLSAFTWLVLRR